ncbi:ABC transporter G family member 23-like [Phalaenopsis equestris]|uniref:ABC transporter G family member 23-like n=1 Tax=Phalaenopsis equestris TaxID=78828 RepID=UPI0009E60D2E|nr:ABC transporter G family member 23-like [Phalaenopsis equestris]
MISRVIFLCLFRHPACCGLRIWQKAGSGIDPAASVKDRVKGDVSSSAPPREADLCPSAPPHEADLCRRSSSRFPARLLLLFSREAQCRAALLLPPSTEEPKPSTPSTFDRRAKPNTTKLPLPPTVHFVPTTNSSPSLPFPLSQTYHIKHSFLPPPLKSKNSSPWKTIPSSSPPPHSPPPPPPPPHPPPPSTSPPFLPPPPTNSPLKTFPTLSTPPHSPSSTNSPNPAEVLKSISFSARSGAGELLAIVGPSGAGKSTLLSIVSGRVQRSKFNPNSVWFDGMQVRSPGRLRRLCGFVTQEDNLLPLLTVKETLMFSAMFRLKGISNKEREQRVCNLMEVGFMFSGSDIFDLAVWLIVLMASSLVLFLSAVASDYVVGNYLICVFLGFFFLFSGYFIGKESLPKFWLFMYYASLYRYPLDALLVNEYWSDRQRCFKWLGGEQGTVCLMNGGDALRSRGLEKDIRWVNVGVMCGFFFLYRVLCWLVLVRRASRTML